MATVEWTDEATQQLDLIVGYIAHFNLAVAQRTASDLFALGESLAYAPRRGRPAAHGTRELVTVKPFILRYDVDEDGEVVTILGIRHSAQLPPD